jgi:hypothetical protein
MALRLRDVQRDTIANRALSELMHHYTVAGSQSSLLFEFATVTESTVDRPSVLYWNDRLRRRAAKQRHELAPFHWPMPPVLGPKG